MFFYPNSYIYNNHRRQKPQGCPNGNYLQTIMQTPAFSKMDPERWNLHLELLLGSLTWNLRTSSNPWNPYLELRNLPKPTWNLGTSCNLCLELWNLLDPLLGTLPLEPGNLLEPCLETSAWNFGTSWILYLEPFLWNLETSWNLVLKPLLGTLEPPGSFTWNPSFGTWKPLGTLS